MLFVTYCNFHKNLIAVVLLPCDSWRHFKTGKYSFFLEISIFCLQETINYIVNSTPPPLSPPMQYSLELCLLVFLVLAAQPVFLFLAVHKLSHEKASRGMSIVVEEGGNKLSSFSLCLHSQFLFPSTWKSREIGS